MNSNNFIIIDQLNKKNSELLKEIEDLKKANKVLDDENSDLYEELIVLHADLYEVTEKLNYFKNDDESDPVNIYLTDTEFNDAELDSDDCCIFDVPTNNTIPANTYFKDYFANVLKEKTRFCDVCNCDIKYSSYNNHIKSKRHNKKINK